MSAPTAESVLTPAELLAHWQGHRRLTRRTIEAFPDEQLNTFAVGGMRPFGTLVVELLGMAAPTVHGFATGEWTEGPSKEPKPKAELLRLWDASTKEMEKFWPQIPLSRFHEKINAFGQWEDLAYRLVLYVIDNEIHHRAQGYVYLRALNIEPPHFWERD